MRIAYLSTSEIPSRAANSVHVMHMSQAFAALGHEVHLIAFTGTEPVDDPFAFYGVERSFDLVRLPRLRWSRRAYVYGMMAARRAVRLRPDLVYGRLLPGCFFAALSGLPIVYESHAPVHGSGRLAQWMFAYLLRHGRLDKVVVISEALRRHYIESAGLPPGLVAVARDAADPPRSGISAHGPGPGTLRIGYVGQLLPGRGIEVLLEMARRCRWAEFHLIGGNPGDVMRWRSMAQGTGNISFHGFMPPAQTDGYRQDFDVLIAPYQRRVAVYGGRGDTSRWMSPLKIFEYMATGRPILCSDLPVLREVLDHERTALLCDPDNIDAWVAALVRLRDDPALRRRLGQAAAAEFGAKYTWAARAAHILGVLPERSSAVGGLA